MVSLDGNDNRSPLCAALARQIRDRSGCEAIRSEGENLSVTFSELADRISARAAALNIPAGDLAGMAVGNSTVFVELFFALRLKGIAVLLLDPGLKPEGSVEICRKMGARWLFLPDADPLRVEPGNAPPPGTAIVKLTSGSTLAPRGACFTDEALLEGIDHIRRGMSLTPDDRVLLSIPLSHSYGFDNAILSLAAIGTPLILQPDVLPAALLRTIRDLGITFFPAVPALVRALAGVEWPKATSLRSVICASAPLPQESAEAFARASGIRVQQFFGATESGGISFETRPGEPEANGAVGFPLPGVRIELHPERGVCVHSAANRFAIMPAGPEPVPPHVETGDRAEITTGGRLRLLGRTTEVANIGGVKIDLAAIDAFLCGLPGVDDAASLAVDDAARGQRIVAWVETRSHEPAAIRERCRERLSAREVPSDIRVTDRLPRTERGKLDRAALLREEAARV